MFKSNSFFSPLPLLFLSLFFSPSSAHNHTVEASSSAGLGLNHEASSSSAASAASAASAHSDSHHASSSSNQATSFPSNYKGSFSKVYAFGDSYTDTGNAQSMGDVKINAPSGTTANGKAMNRFCDGRLVVDFLCDSLSIPPLSPYKSSGGNFTNGANFAIAGSTSLASDFFLKQKISLHLPWKLVPTNIQTQIDWFNQHMQEVECKGKDEKACTAAMENSLFWIGGMGVNDYSRSFSSYLNLQRLPELCVGHVCILVKALLDRGAKYLVVQGLPPLGCLPLGILLCPKTRLDQLKCSAVVNAAIMLHNQILKKKVEFYQAQYPDRTIIYADYWNAYVTILMNPQKYQFEETFKACCGAGDGKLNVNERSLCGSSGTSTCKDPSKYINWDGIHLTEAMYKHVTDLFLNQGFCQPTFDQLIKKKCGK